MKKNITHIMIFGMILFITALSIYRLNRDDNQKNSNLNMEIAPVLEKKVELVTLYFPDKGRQYLVRENRVIEQTIEKKEELILKELIKGPVSDQNAPSIPSGVKINAIIYKEDTIYIDLSKELKTEMDFSGNSEILTIYSIVNSLTELKTVKNVKIMIDGEEGILHRYMPLDNTYKQNFKLVHNSIQNPIEVVKNYFSFIESGSYREAYDLIYKPAHIDLDYSMFYHYQKQRNIYKFNIYTYEMTDEEDSKVVTLEYSEIDGLGKRSYYSNQKFYLKNYYGEWKIVFDNISNIANAER